MKIIKTNLNYRPEIDGLRAIAVLPVIFSHAGFSMFSGGFIGVDVFFVISGYLITSIILKEKRSGLFSLALFYERRVRRIIPPLLIMMIFSAIAAYSVLSPSEMKSFSQSLVAVILSSSNILFWKTVGYFEPTSNLKPLLHTWSLGVEEEFYAIFPLLFLFRWKDGSRKLTATILILFFSSFLCAELLVKTHPYFAFYNLPTRAWEILIGAFVAVLPRQQNDCAPTKDSSAFQSGGGQYLGSRYQQPNPLGSQIFRSVGTMLTGVRLRGLRALVLGAIGIISILLPYAIYDENTATPGKNVLIPTIGAALVLHFASCDNLIGRLLSISPLRWVGLLSYSAYLWHQPIFVFARYYFGSRIESVGFIMLIVLVFAVAYASYRFIEIPWRNQKTIGRRKGGAILISVACMLLVFGLVGHLTKGFPERFSDKELVVLNHFENSLPKNNYYYSNCLHISYRDDCNFYNISANKNGSSTVVPVSTNLPLDCFTRKNSYSKVVFIWGDSHAQHLNSGLKKNLPANWEILQVASSACHPQIESESSPGNYCDFSNWFALNCIKNSRPDVVVVSQDRNYDVKIINSIYKKLRQYGVGKVVFVGPSPRWLISLPEVYLSTIKNKDLDLSIFIDKNILAEDLYLKNTIKSTELFRYVSAVDCLQGNPDGIFIGAHSYENLMFFDSNHLTLMGSDYFARQALVREIVDGFE